MNNKERILIALALILSSVACKKIVGTIEDAQKKLETDKTTRELKHASEEIDRAKKSGGKAGGQTALGSLANNPFAASFIAEKIESFKKSVPLPSTMVKDSHYAHFGDLYFLSGKGLNNEDAPTENAYWSSLFSKIDSDGSNFFDFQKTFNSLMAEESTYHSLSNYASLLDNLQAPENKVSQENPFIVDYKEKKISFDPLDFNFNPSNAIVLALMSQKIAHDDSTQVSEQFLEWKFSSFASLLLQGENQTDVDSDGKVFVAVKDNQHFVLFKGSQTKRDWKSNMHSRLVDQTSDEFFSKGKIHQGFYNTLGNFWKNLEPQLKKVPNDDFVWFVGHSRGGALALLAALKHVKNGGKAIVYTYGQPRAVDDDFAREAQNLDKERFKYFRLQAKEDIVSYVPPSSASEEAMKAIDPAFLFFKERLSSYPTEDLLEVLGIKMQN